MQWDDTKNAGFSTAHSTCYFRCGLCQQERQDKTIAQSVICHAQTRPHTAEAIMLDTTNPPALSRMPKGSAGHRSILVVLKLHHRAKNSFIRHPEGPSAPDRYPHTLASDTSLEHQSSLTGITLPAYRLGREPEIDKTTQRVYASYRCEARSSGRRIASKCEDVSRFVVFWASHSFIS